jgi:hypothetical protein
MLLPLACTKFGLEFVFAFRTMLPYIITRSMAVLDNFKAIQIADEGNLAIGRGVTNYLDTFSLIHSK